MARQDVLDLYRDSGLRLSDFEVGDNRELLSQLMQLEQQPNFRFLMLWGGASLGKSHLLQGSCADFHARGRSSVYIPLALAELEPDVLTGLESFELVCLDDIDRRFGDRDWETALFHLFNRLREHNAALLISARQSPRQAEIALADLKSRLNWGLVYQVQPLPEALQCRFLQQQAHRRGIELSDTVVNYILTHYARDMSSLLSLLEQLDRRSLEQQRRITVPFLKSVLSTL